MARLPAITVIQASDAPQHTGKLREILQNLQSENRIGSFTTVDAEEDLSSIAEAIEEEDLVLIVLTNQLEAQKTQIENNFKPLEAKVAEIIVDHVTYDNEFLTFPADLRPIRDREDMDAVWGDIEQNFRNMFPVKEPEQESSAWLQGVLEWPWQSPGRWHGALFLGVPAFVVITIGLYLAIPIDFEREPLTMLLLSFLAGGVYGIAGAISRMRKASLFFAVTLAIGVMMLFLVFWGIGVDDYHAAALVFIGPVSAVVGAWVGLSDDPIRLTGMILLGLWPWLFAESAPHDSPFLLNSIIIAAVLCIIAWLKPVKPKRAVKSGTLPFVLNLTGGYLIYMMAPDRALDGSAFGLTIITVIAAVSLGLVYWLNKKKYSGDA